MLIFARLRIANRLAIGGTRLTIPIEHAVIGQQGTGRPIVGKLPALGTASGFVFGIIRSALLHASSLSIVEATIPFAPVSTAFLSARTLGIEPRGQTGITVGAKILLFFFIAFALSARLVIFTVKLVIASICITIESITRLKAQIFFAFEKAPILLVASTLHVGHPGEHVTFRFTLAFHAIKLAKVQTLMVALVGGGVGVILVTHNILRRCRSQG